MRILTVLVGIAVTLGTMGAAPTVASPVEEPASLNSQIHDVRTDPSPVGPSIFTFVGESTYAGPEEVQATAGPMVSETAELDTADLDGADEDTPYRYLFRAAPTVRGEHGSTVTPGAGFAHDAWYYAGLPEGSYVHDGESMQSLVGVTTPTPLFPPRDVTTGGELAWEAAESLTYDLETTDWDPENEAWETAHATATGFSAVLRVDGGGLVAEDDVTSPVLRIPLADGFSGLASTVRPTALPGVSFDVDSGFATDPDGSSYYEIQVTVDEGTQWPESGDEAPGGSWKLVVQGFAMTWPTFTQDTADNLETSQGAIQADLGPIPPGLQGTLETTTGLEKTLPQTSALTFSIGEDEELRLHHYEPWPEPSTEADHGGASLDASDEACGTQHQAPAHAGGLDEGAVSFDLSQDGTIAEDVCVRGVPVGSFGLPLVEVDGIPYAPELVDGAPEVRAYHYETDDRSGAQLVLTFRAAAGPVEYTATLPLDARLDADNAEALSGFLLSIQDFHATDQQRHEVRFAWTISPDAGDEEAFQAYGEQALETESIVPNPGQGGNLAIGSHAHTITGTGATHTLDAYAPTGIVVTNQASLVPSPVVPVPPEAHIVPPEPLEDVSLLAPHPMEGAYMGWMDTRGNLVDRAFYEDPSGLGPTLQAGFLIAQAYGGQLGFTGFHTVDA